MTGLDYGEKIDGGWFKESTHTYRDEEGVIHPSVTQIWPLLGIDEFVGVPKDLLEWKRDYGLAVHRAIKLLVENDLDWETVDEQILAAVTGLERWLKSVDFKVEENGAERKQVAYCYGMRYGMTIDLIGELNWGGKRRKGIVDLKSGVKKSPTWDWQLGGYITAQPPRGLIGVIAQFDKSGKVAPYQIDAQKAQREFQTLLAASLIIINAGLAAIGR